MDIGIVGAAGAGRTTVFRALLAHRAPKQAGARSASGSIGTIQVREPRLDRLAELFQPRKVTPVEIRVHDVCPSLEPTFPKEEIEAMKRLDQLLLVVPAFADASPEASRSALGQLIERSRPRRAGSRRAGRSRRRSPRNRARPWSAPA
jgi:ATPase subunit of ABC transporter with duplicated ATPase domains